MEVELTPDQEAFVQQVVDSGRLNQSEIAQEAFALWEDRERRRLEILAALDVAESELDSGAFVDYTDAALPELAARLKLEARAVLVAGSNG